MKTQTAVEWLQSEIDNKDMGEIPMWIYKFMEQAKVMEKQQIIDAWVESAKQGSNHDLLEREIDAETEFAEQHYKETYETKTT
jgi:hypothetical protein